MLTINRRSDESVFIFPKDVPEGMTVAELFADGPIEILIRRIDAQQVKMGIDAPKALTILRDELMEFEEK